MCIGSTPAHKREKNKNKNKKPHIGTQKDTIINSYKYSLTINTDTGFSKRK